MNINIVRFLQKVLCVLFLPRNDGANTDLYIIYIIHLWDIKCKTFKYLLFIKANFKVFQMDTKLHTFKVAKWQ